MNFTVYIPDQNSWQTNMSVSAVQMRNSYSLTEQVMAQVEVFLGQTLIPKHPQVKIEYNRTGK